MIDLEKLKKLNETCHEVTVMWFTKKGRSLGDSNGSPTLIAEMVAEIESLNEGREVLRESVRVAIACGDTQRAKIDSLKYDLEKIARATVSDLASAKVVVLAAHNRLSAENVTPRDLRSDPVVYAVNKLVMQRENEIIRELRTEVAQLKDDLLGSGGGE